MTQPVAAAAAVAGGHGDVGCRIWLPAWLLCGTHAAR
jgi:hypothetical protein